MLLAYVAFLPLLNMKVRGQDTHHSFCKGYFQCIEPLSMKLQFSWVVELHCRQGHVFSAILIWAFLTLNSPTL